MQFVLICHDDEPLTRDGMARWLGSFADLVAVVVISEDSSRLSTRIKKEVKRSGLLGFLDVIAFRIYHKLFFAKLERSYEYQVLEELNSRFSDVSSNTNIHYTSSPNCKETQNFLEKLEFDFAIARCKSILKEDIFSLAKKGTFVMHPGVCPEYRNAHGCFWAMVNEDYERIGMTLLKVDKGIDTGPIYGFYGGDFDLLAESHNTIQAKVVFNNLTQISEKFKDIYEGSAETIDVTGHKSGTWGQPWLSKYLKWKYNYKKNKAR
jgi:hypothetical protein